MTSLGGFLIAGYIATFLAATVDFSATGTGDAFIKLFAALCLLEYGPLYFLHFGIFSQLKVPAFTSSLRLINHYVQRGRVREIHSEEDIKKLHISLERLPQSNMIAAAIYPTVVMLAVTIQELVIGSMTNAFYLFLGISSAIGIYIFYTFVVAELLTGGLRRQVKRLMVMRHISFQEKSYSSIRRKFIFISVLVLLAMIELGLMFVNQTGEGIAFLPWLYIGLTAVVVGSLMFFYLLSIEDALVEIESAALDLGRGGKGKLYGRSLDKEFVRMSKGIVSAAYEVNEIRKNLEKKVQERTDELQETLAEVRNLKEKQDGDYFLTSLLTDALVNINQAANKTVKIESYIEEKKKFSFRKWDREIGGDMCMAYTIQLRGRPYTMVLNADAMGKSIQGAGGVLVMGSVVKFLVERTLDITSLKSRQYPEFWIQSAYQDLQKIFESFDGSMLMSMILALVDEQKGLFYFINVEHPWLILYRDGKASFVEKELTLHKVGTPIVAEDMMVQTFAMEPGDVLFMGSDGRDDIMLGTDEQTGARLINEDETAILQHIEQGEGQLQGTVTHIKSFGELTDDLSLFRLEFCPFEAKKDAKKDAKKEATEISAPSVLDRAKHEYKKKEYQQVVDALSYASFPAPEEKERYRLLVNSLMALKEYERAYYFADKAQHNFPGENRFLYMCSVAAKSVKKWKKAIDHGERYHLRMPNDSKNLVNLADCYRLAGNRNAAQKLYQRILQLDSESNYVLRLGQKLEK